MVRDGVHARKKTGKEFGEMNRRRFVGAEYLEYLGLDLWKCVIYCNVSVEYLGLDLWKCVIFRRLVCFLLFIC